MLEKSIRTKCNLDDIEIDRLIGHKKRIEIDEILKQHKKQVLKLKTKVKDITKL